MSWSNINWIRVPKDGTEIAQLASAMVEKIGEFQRRMSHRDAIAATENWFIEREGVPPYFVEIALGEAEAML